MSYEQLQAVQSNPVVPMPLVMEALMARLKQHGKKRDKRGERDGSSERKQREHKRGDQVEMFSSPLCRDTERD
jgi:hypothetical protein